MNAVRVSERSRRVGKTAAADLAKQTATLAHRLEAGVSKRALAEAIASQAVVRGVVDERSGAQIEADLMAELRRWEQVAALRGAAQRTGSKS